MSVCSPSAMADASHQAEAFVVAIVWLGREVAVACGDGHLRFLSSVTPAGRVPPGGRVHAGAILSAAAHPDGRSVLTGGDDGRLVRTWPSGESEEIATFGRNWVEQIEASTVSGVVACAVGKDAVVLDTEATGVSHAFSQPSTVSGVALDAKGRRLAVSHYGGATLFWASAPEAASKRLAWAGSHLSVGFSPSGRFLVTAMQENAVHGWRLADGTGMHMQGYPAKPRSFAWTHKGQWLVTAGAERVVCWPFAGKDGPMNKAPAEIGPGSPLVTRVACQPGGDAMAAGYEDGSALLLRLADDDAAVLQAAAGEPVSALAWSPRGDQPLRTPRALPLASPRTS